MFALGHEHNGSSCKKEIVILLLNLNRGIPFEPVQNANMSARLTASGFPSFSKKETKTTV